MFNASFSVPSAGFDQSITVSSQGQFSSPVTLLSYAAPDITSVTGCPIVGASPTATADCARVGGTTITIAGSNFGSSKATVLVGALNCNNTVHDPANPHGRLTCALPPGTSRVTSLAVLQRRGEISATRGNVAYKQCGPGYKDAGVAACVACVPGQFTQVDGQTACLLCASGSFQNASHASTCVAWWELH